MDQNLQYVLDFCNEIRRALGHEPVETLIKGIRRDGNRCPIANTINFGLTERISAGLAGIAGVTGGLYPEGIRTFLNYFDNGFIPQLEGSGKVE